MAAAGAGYGGRTPRCRRSLPFGERTATPGCLGDRARHGWADIPL